MLWLPKLMKHDKNRQVKLARAENVCFHEVLSCKRPSRAFMTKLMGCVLCLLLLSSCHQTAGPLISTSQKLPATVSGASDKQIMVLERHMGEKGIQLITIGQNYLLIIPSSVLFPHESPDLTWASFNTLNQVVAYLKQFRKISVHVHAFGARVGSKERERALTHARATAVAEYLWEQGVDTRLLITQGFGSHDRILPKSTSMDEDANSRIEISFRRAVG